MKIKDGDWSLYEYDVKLGRQVWFITNPDGSTTFRTDYEVQPTIDINRAQKNLAQDNWAGDYHHIASVPLNIFHEQMAEASRQDDQTFISKWLNDGDNSAWRTKDGAV